MTKERPILFSAPMVRALLAGTKTQTRRVCKSQPYANGFHFDGHDFLCHNDYLPPSAMLMDCRRGGIDYTTSDHEGWTAECPYGQPGDRLWVRETFAIERSVEPDQQPPHNDGRPTKHRPADDYECAHPLWQQAHYRATDPAPELVYEEGPAGGREGEIGVRWKPCIHMPRWASRILLEIVSVRVERLNDISEADAAAEGWPGPDATSLDAMAWYSQLWDEINGPGAWEANTWVWVVEFKRAA
ncbi:hypothetical protein [Roseateles sp. P5_E11]